VVERGEFYVLGVGALYVIDCREVSDSNIAESAPEKSLSVYDVKLHLLTQGHAFDLTERRPRRLTDEQCAKKIPPTKSAKRGK
jgi:cyanophycinase